MKKSTIFQNSMSEPDNTEDWENLSYKQKNEIIRTQANVIAGLLLVIAFLIFRKF